MRTHTVGLVLLSVGALATTAEGGSYKGAAVANGGAIKGTVTMSGSAPKLAVHKVTKDHGTCGQHAKNESLMIGSGGRVAQAVVFLEGITSGKPMTKKKARLDQKGCTYLPHVQATTAGSAIELNSSDPILHNVRGSLGKRLIFNVAMPTKGQKINKKLKKPGLVSISCDAGHTWMSSFVYVFDHPYFSVTGMDGSFNLSDVPPGKYKLTVWHERLGTKSSQVTVTAGGTANADFKLQAK